jgi:hypothetical protein
MGALTLLLAVLTTLHCVAEAEDGESIRLAIFSNRKSSST